uniref:Uncharacterized protein n=1 Tax=uncultured marine virus TaxID=186617 RepID=A0A0F7LA69_9VIRU|nr:hypothetical protein [uncultured marine virus]
MGTLNDIVSSSHPSTLPTASHALGSRRVSFKSISLSISFLLTITVLQIICSTLS